jgi:hypothetical protein
MRILNRSRARFSAAVWLILLPTLVSGCGYPNAQPNNKRLISSLRTALSARNDQWLTANEKRVGERHKQGEMDDDEFAAFQEIIEQARGGDWQGAERAAVDFQRAQRPTEEQIHQHRAKQK